MSEPKPSLLEQASAMVREQSTNSVAGAVVASKDQTAAQVGVKAGGSNWSLAAWMRWAKDKWTGKRERSVGAGGEFRW